MYENLNVLPMVNTIFRMSIENFTKEKNMKETNSAPHRIHNAAIDTCSRLTQIWPLPAADFEDVIEAYLVGTALEIKKLNTEQQREFCLWLAGRTWEGPEVQRVLSAGREFAKRQINEIHSNPLRWRFGNAAA